MKGKNFIFHSLCVFSILVTISCKNYLDIVPDNIATIDNAFTMRDQAEKYLFTCYSYMPKDGDLGSDPAMTGGDEIWRLSNTTGLFDIAKGLQNVVGPIAGQHWDNLFKGLRDCNIFLENIEKVPDLEEYEKRKWIAEVKFLKAYYHFYLLRMYGPIPIIKESLPVGTDVNAVKLYRDPVDSCFSYIVQLIDEAKENLPLQIDNPADDLGRITLPIALSLKAKVLVFAASPQFNGNSDVSFLENNDGVSLFNGQNDLEKWGLALMACKDAIDVCHEAQIELFKYNRSFSQYNLGDTMSTQLSLRNSVTEKWNSEIIWANTQTSVSGIQSLMTPSLLDPAFPDNPIPRGELSPPLKIAEQFYSEHGVPIEEDNTWDYNNRYDLQVGDNSSKLYIRQGYTTSKLHFNREPRFYADLGFDGGIWFGQGKYDDKNAQNLFFVEAKWGQRSSAKSDRSTVTGYFMKKLVHFQNVINSSTYSATTYPWPILRLADLYLLYAEALNEYKGPSEEAVHYVDLVRERAGLKSVAYSWDNYSNNPSKYTSQRGLREIIQQERLIEMTFEGQRFWDLRRWKQAADELNKPIMSWDLTQSDPAGFYVPKIIFNQTFSSREYFWPIKESDISIDRNLVQNVGW
ncbi:Starch-binding associating with outer membrane [bacterium A37T11]|nr:Starch-binding associating with outer membrane [bacterium A37T11]